MILLLPLSIVLHFDYLLNYKSRINTNMGAIKNFVDIIYWPTRYKLYGNQ